jgi:hypothetical protein
MSPSKHATYQRLVALKSCFWRADQLLPELQQLTGADVEVGAAVWGLGSVERNALGQCKARLESFVLSVFALPTRGCHLPLPLQAFLPSLLAGLHLEALVHGNITATQATTLARQLHETLGGVQLGADQRPAERCVQLPKGCDMLHR